MPLGGLGVATAVKAAGVAAKVVGGLSKSGEEGGGIGGMLSSIGGKAKGSGADALGAALAIGQKIKAKSLKKKADAALPQMEDPEVRKMQRQFARRKRAFQTGTAQASQRRSMEKMFATGSQRAMKFGAGGRSGLNKMTEMFNQGMQGLANQGLQGELSYAGLEKDVVNRLAQRKLELGMQKHDELAAEAAGTKKTANMNMGAILGRKLGVGNTSQQSSGGGMSLGTQPTEEPQTV